MLNNKDRYCTYPFLFNLLNNNTMNQLIEQINNALVDLYSEIESKEDVILKRFKDKFMYMYSKHEWEIGNYDFYYNPTLNQWAYLFANDMTDRKSIELMDTPPIDSLISAGIVDINKGRKDEPKFTISLYLSFPKDTDGSILVSYERGRPIDTMDTTKVYYSKGEPYYYEYFIRYFIKNYLIPTCEDEIDTMLGEYSYKRVILGKLHSITIYITESTIKLTLNV